MENKGFEIKCLECGSKKFKIESVTGYCFDRDGHQDFYTKGFIIVCCECKNKHDTK